MANRRGKVHVYPTVLIHRLPRTEGVAEKRELDVGVILGSIDVLAVHDPCFAWMQFELARLEPFSNAIKHVFCLPFTFTMEHSIVSVSGEPDARQMPHDPHIKRI